MRTCRSQEANRNGCCRIALKGVQQCSRWSLHANATKPSVLQDLLRPENENLQIRESETGVFVAGVHEKEVKGMEDCLHLLQLGERNRCCAVCSFLLPTLMPGSKKALQQSSDATFLPAHHSQGRRERPFPLHLQLREGPTLAVIGRRDRKCSSPYTCIVTDPQQ